MKKLSIVSILAMCIACPAFATGIDADNTSPDCDNATLGTYVGPTTLKAEWNANTINLKWYDHNGEIQNVQNASQTCTYADGITLQTTPSRTGYQFSGWQVIVPFDLSTLSSNVNTNGLYYSSKNFAGDYCYYYYYDENTEEENEIDSDTCSENEFSGLSTGEWKTNLSYGTVKGIARCSTQHPTTPWYTNNNTFTEDHFASTLADETGQEGAQYCWCLPTGFAEGNSSAFASVSSPSWVFSYDDGNAGNCASDCAYHCANRVRYRSDFRSALYGITE